MKTVEKLLKKNGVAFEVTDHPCFYHDDRPVNVKTRSFDAESEIVSFFNRHRNPIVLKNYKMKQDDGKLYVRFWHPTYEFPKTKPIPISSLESIALGEDSGHIPNAKIKFPEKY